MFESDDPYVADIANAIENLYPGHVKSVNRIIYDDDGRTITDFDIELRNAVIQVKGGSGTGPGRQITVTQTVTDLPVVGYGPNLGKHVMREVDNRGGIAVRSAEDLMELIRP